MDQASPRSRAVMAAKPAGSSGWPIVRGSAAGISVRMENGSTDLRSFSSSRIQRFLLFWVSRVFQMMWRKVFAKTFIITDFALWQAKLACVWSDRKRIPFLSIHLRAKVIESRNDSEVPQTQRGPQNNQELIPYVLTVTSWPFGKFVKYHWH